MIESPGTFPESPMDQDDVVYPCKGCGEILEEGKAFELAGNRWHIDCFRCNTCGLLLDSDANLLLLGDGSLICNNCTYSCSACGNKIEDLAILTGDQAFCASCFRCRNCKRKIENLRYARTSQGIFCMSCHESLMAKRRKHKKSQRQPQSGTKDKALPDLPRGDSRHITQSAFSPHSDVDTTASERFPSSLDPPLQSQHARAHKDKPNGSRREGSPASLADSRRGADMNQENTRPSDNLTLPSSTYKDGRTLSTSTTAASPTSFEGTSGDDGLFVPLVLDPGPALGAIQLSSMDHEKADAPVIVHQTDQAKPPQFKDAVQRKPAPTTAREALREAKQAASRSSSTERRQPQSQHLHIAYEEKGRLAPDQLLDPQRRGKDAQNSISPAPSTFSDVNSILQSYATDPQTPSEFRLQDVPKNRKAISRRSSKSDTKSPSTSSPATEISSKNMSPQIGTPSGPLSTDTDRVRKEAPAFAKTKLSSDQQLRPTMELPKRGDSLQAWQTLDRKDAASVHSSGPVTPTAPSVSTLDRNTPSSTRPAPETTTGPQVGGKPISHPIELTGARSIFDPPGAPPMRSSNRPAPSGAPLANDSFTAPRVAPPPPPPVPTAERHKAAESTSTVQSEISSTFSPVNLPKYSPGADFSLDEDMARILRGTDEPQNEPGVLRKVSNAVKHGRSFSDRGTRSTSSSMRWSGKSPLNGMDISSPTSVQSPDTRDDNATLRNELRRARQRIAELEAEKNSILHQSADLSEVSSQLQDKRNTISFLNTQREIVVRELEVMTEHLQRAKDSNELINLRQLKTDVLHDLTLSIQKLKESLSHEVQSLIKQKDDLTDEISKLIAMKDKGFQEYESLSTRNAQLTQHNNELIHSIQDFYKANRQANGSSIDGGRPFANGLGINLHKDRSDSTDLRSMFSSDASISGLIPESEADTLISTPKVIDIRKAPKGNMLKKGTQGLLRGMRGAFNTDKDRSQDRNNPVQTEGLPYTQMSEPATVPKPAMEVQTRQKFGGLFGSGDRANSSKLNSLKQSQFNSSNPSLTGDTTGGAPSLFGGDLSARCESEKRVIPAIVTRCIEEVELRGMDVEGIYRKSGGNSQVNQVRNGFEANNEFDISDVELDIHAVTSALKQYFRRLPNPLITYEAYDLLLNAVRQDEPEQRLLKTRQCLDRLPRCHRDCLEFLMFHLSRVMEKDHLNLMSPSNLAVVFAPTILRPQSIEREMTDMQIQRTVVQFLLENSKAIFSDP